MSGPVGILPVLKPPGPSSHQVVEMIRHVLGRGTRVGHAGTLDPEAGGVLPICVGAATRLADYLQAPPKVYRFELVLGVVTDTQDATGCTVAIGDTSTVSAERLRAALAAFTGQVPQQAPLYSARHHQGRRLYAIAREGGQAPRPEFQVVIWDFQLLRWTPPAATPPVALCEVCCGSGTYVRALCEDVGRSLGCGGHMGALLRCAAGGIVASECWSLEEIVAAARDGDVERLLLPGAQALDFLPAVTLDEGDAAAIRHGRAPGRRRSDGPDGVQTVRLLDERGGLLAVAVRRIDGDLADFKLEKVLVADEGRG